MSKLVDTETGEVVSLMTRAEAEEITAEIASKMVVLAEDIIEAHDRQAWRALGYESWDAYTDAEFNSSRLRLPREERRPLVDSLSKAGMSTRAIAAATGVSHEQVRQDQKSGVKKLTPEPAAPRNRDEVEPRFGNKVKGLDGKQYPQPKRTPQPVPKKSNHPAEYPRAVLETFRDLIPAGALVLDPFGGRGGIHDLADHCETHAIELEEEWARAHPNTVHGDARDVSEIFANIAFDVIATSPAYGNRLADPIYNAADPEARRSYAIDLGRPLTEGNGAAMRFGHNGSYEALHTDVWTQVVGALQPDGMFLLNCKDFVRDRKVVNVVDWHIRTLTELGLRVVGLRNVPTGGLSHTTAERELIEQVVIFTAGGVDAG